MVDPESLRAAVDARVITKDQARKLDDLMRAREAGSGETETLRFLNNLNDIFLSLGLVLLVIGLVIALGFLVLGKTGFDVYGPTVLLPVATAVWGLAEYFCGRRRMLLPSMVLVLMFALLIGGTAASVAAFEAAKNAAGAAGAVWAGQGDEDLIRSTIEDNALSTSLIGLGAAALGALAFYVRFRLPFSLFVIAGTIAAMIYAIMVKQGGLAVFLGGGIMLAVGVATLLSAIAFDAQDPQRATRLSDNAFWLHVAAAPQIIYGVRGVLGIESFSQDFTQALVTVAVIVALSLLSVALNRRALLVSGVITFSGAIWALFDQSGVTGAAKFAGPLILIGGLIVLLGGGWRTARDIVLTPLPKTGPLARIFPPETHLNG